MPPRPSQKLSELLGLDIGVLTEIIESSEESYYQFSLPKRSGRRRWIDAPLDSLKDCQRRLLVNILYQMPIHDAAHGFVRGRSILTNARCHERQSWVIKFDIKDFFPTTTRTQVIKALQTLPDLPSSDAEIIGSLVTRRGVLPQGAPTSPHLANAVFRATDEDLLAVASRHGLRYSRYADDLTFSGLLIPPGYKKQVEYTVSEAGYQLAHQKTRTMGRHQRQLVTGLVVNDRARLPRPMRRRLRAVIHDIECRGLPAAVSRSPWVTENQLWGYFSFSKMLDDVANEFPLSLSKKQM